MDIDFGLKFDDMGRAIKKYQQFGETLHKVDQALYAALMILKLTAFVGLVGGKVVEAYIEHVRPIIQRLAKKCDEVSEDLQQAVNIFAQARGETAPKFR